MITYRLVLDSAKVFYANVFLYMLFFEFYVVEYVWEIKYTVQLPFYGLFLTGIFTFAMLTIWLNIAQVWYRKGMAVNDAVVRAIVSELPFIIPLIIAWVVVLRIAGGSSIIGIVTAFTAYQFLFPAIVFAAKSHMKKIDRLTS